MRLKRWIGAGILVLAVIVLLSLLIAPQGQQRQGSTYSRDPSGYGAWYAYMEQQGLPIQRWQRPVSELFNQIPLPPVEEIASRKGGTQAQIQSPLNSITLLQINDRSVWFKQVDEDWVKRGNVLILVGVRAPVSQAPFRSWISSSVGAVKIQTSRREPNRQSVQPQLQDQYGMVVWEKKQGQGKIFYVATPHLAANAYQNEAGNFQFLAQLAAAPGHPIYIDEYLHGYRDHQEQVQDEVGAATSESLVSYLAKTPLLLLAIQVIVMILVLIWGQNQRLGRPRSVSEASIDNSKAYIQALAAVLQKADCSEFVVETIGKAEQQQIQRALGLGSTLLEPQVVIDAWAQQTRRPAAEMQEILQPAKSRRWSDSALRVWLNKLQNVQRQLK